MSGRWKIVIHELAAFGNFANCFRSSTAERIHHARAGSGCGCTTTVSRDRRRRYLCLVGSRPVAFLDMGWPDFKVAVEYDGDHHRKDRRQYVKDIARLQMLEAMGWIVIRVIAEDRPEAWLGRVEEALERRGYQLHPAGSGEAFAA